MKTYFALFLLSAAYLSTGFFISRINFSKQIYTASTLVQEDDFYDYRGVINVHSKKSSGSESVQNIIRAATESNLDFIFFNETNPMNQKQPPSIKFGSLNVFYGFELSYGNTRLLYTTLDSDKVFTSFSEAEIYLSSLLESGGEELLILSHPNKPGYEWPQEKRPDHISGLEVLNLREVWRTSWEDHKLNFLWALLFYPFNPELFFLSIYSDQALAQKMWQDWGEQKPTMGFLGSDATSKLRLSKSKSLNFPSYKSIFAMAQNHILLSEELLGYGDNQAVLEALRSGRSYFSIDILGSPKGFLFFGEQADGSILHMGQETNLAALQKLTVKVPPTQLPLKVLLYKDNLLIQEHSGDFSFETKTPGIYRVEVRVKPPYPIFRLETWVPWIFSNPIFVRP